MLSPPPTTNIISLLVPPQKGFFAKRDIAKGEDLTFDYQFERTGNVAQRCLCGASNCSGWIGSRKKTEGEPEEMEEDIEEQSFDELKDDDVLAIGDKAVRPDEPVKYVPKTETRKEDDAANFIVTLDCLPALMRCEWVELS